MEATTKPITRLLVIGLLFHLVYIGTVFDCYFKSPVVHGMQPFNAGFSLAKRLVLIVADGLRADSALSYNAFPAYHNSTEPVAPHLRSIVRERGAFGVSHTRVPTESRPGHVALIGGMYEDVSAVTKGWKTNPVDFDSVFNQSSTTFSFGSPDILPIFAHGAIPGRIHTWSYDENDEDFTKEASTLDTWVLEHLEILFQNATSDPSLDVHLRQEKTVFFLHLLGLDVTGHSHRPHSQEYMENIKVVDDIVKRTERLVSQFYGDEDTVFIFTADHGMSKIGNHGDGDPDNTRTPLITWGKGIRGPLPDSNPSSHDGYSLPWDLNDIYRRDVEQADVTALMSALIGINWPINSVGVLPDVDPTRPGFLDGGDGDMSEAKLALVNAKVVLEHFKRKHYLKKQHTLFYRPFGSFSREGNDNPGELEVKAIESLIAAGKWFEARQASAQLIQTSLVGLRYLQTYDQTLIRVMVVIAYLGWAAYGATTILFHDYPPSFSTAISAVALVVLGISWTLFAVQKYPLTFFIYVVFPCYFWRAVLVKCSGPLLGMYHSNKLRGSTKLLFRSVFVIAALQSMVVGYTHRGVWSIGFLALGFIWPAWHWPEKILEEHPITCLMWIVLCLATAVFPMLDVNQSESLGLIMAGGASMVGIGCLASLKLGYGHGGKTHIGGPFAVQILLLVLTMLITASSAHNLRSKRGLPLVNQILGWVILVSASLFPFVYPVKHRTPHSKILSYFLAFSACFVILSISVEGLFFVSYSALLVVWVEIEVAIRSPPSRTDKSTDAQAEGASGAAVTGKATTVAGYRPRADDLRIALFFLFFVQVAFFGTGNVASISSFYLDPVYRLIPIFSPFSMAALLMFKVVAPFVILASVFATLNARLHLPPFSLFLVALTLTDGMTVAFFFKVTDTGSWLEIGQSISFFCITSLLLVWSAGICALGESLMAGTLVECRVPRAGDRKED